MFNALPVGAQSVLLLTASEAFVPFVICRP